MRCPRSSPQHPDALYVMVGATHPDLLLREGEAYRRSLADRVATLGMEDHVQFIDRFVGQGRADPVAPGRRRRSSRPYPNMAQIVSGTLSYAMGAGRAVVSTPYAYAAELLAEGRGVLVPPASADGLATALNQLLGEPALRVAIGKRAYAHSAGMVWSAVGAQYRALFADLAGHAAVAGGDALPVAVPITASSGAASAPSRAGNRAPELAASRG